MGAGMTRRLAEAGHSVLAFDRSPDASEAAQSHGVRTFPDVPQMLAAMKAPRTVWIMVPSGVPTEETVASLSGGLQPGDVVVDGGNSYYKDSIRRAAMLAEHRIAFLDAGTSGGTWGYEAGFCLMVGGEADAFARVQPAFASLAPPNGYAHVGPAGAGHFAKMIHNGIEYAMLQAYGEGFDILAASPYGYDLAQVSSLWEQGSVVRSWLLELLTRALKADPQLASVPGFVEDSGEGRWTIKEAIDLDVPAPAITMALYERFASRRDESFSAKVIAALRREFGGHAIGKDAP